MGAGVIEGGRQGWGGGMRSFLIPFVSSSTASSHARSSSFFFLDSTHAILLASGGAMGYSAR